MSITGRVDVGLQVYDAVNNALTLSGLSRDTTKKYAYFAWELYKYIEARPHLQTALQGAKSIYQGAKGAKGYVVASRLAANATKINGISFAEKYAVKGNISAGTAMSAFVDYFMAVGKSLHLEMNECAVALTKVMLDVLATVALAETVVGLWAVALQALAVGADTKEMMNACLPGV